MAASSNTTVQPKYALGNSSDGLRNAFLAPYAASDHQVFPRIRDSDSLRIALPAPSATLSVFDGLVNPFSASANTCAESSSQIKHLPYDVFINHCGKDAKETIARNIYKKLDEKGLRVFLDKDELRFGDFFPETIKAAMHTSKVHIAIFSENYAASSWCLDELEFMLQLPNIKFIPIFYHVEPFILRWAIKGKGIYAEAFKEHEIKSRYQSKRLENWKSALNRASLYTGASIRNQGEEEKAVTNVVNDVLKELKKLQINVAKHPVGLDEAEQDFNNTLLNSAAGNVQMVGICGMGGAGKTTLAKHLFNKRSLTFNGSSCFVPDVREAARKEVLYEKQKELLNDLYLGSKEFNNVDKGKEILRSRLKSVLVLIVLDDVDHTDQLDALLPGRDSLGPGSLIIVTTRDLRVLEAWDISAIHKIKTLDPVHAEKLFCWHAFGQPSPLSGFEDLAKKFIKACHGLPLSLKVFGSLLHGKSSKIYWQSQLDKVSRIVPDDIKSRLRISYDALDEEEKEMFLDVACFFIGESSSRAIAVWDVWGWSGLLGWQTLVDKCLVELHEYHDIIKMHDHLRDLAREITNKRSPYRLWSKKQIIEIQPQQVAVQVRGMADAFGDNCYPRQGHIILNTNQGELTLPPGSLGLKICIAHGDFIDEQYGGLTKDLVYLRWDNFQHKNLPSWLPLKKLRILRLQGLWERDADAPSALKELSIHGAHRMEKIESLKGLASLEELVIDSCSKLDGLPSLGELTSLRKIQLTCCYKLQKIESLEGLKSLQILHILMCSELKALPSLRESTLLKEIGLGHCNILEKIESLKGLASLEKLGIAYCSQLDGLPSLGELTSLRMINLKVCHKLQKIEGLEGLKSLQRLQIQECIELKALPSLRESTLLKKIQLSYCDRLEKIESLKGLASLEKLVISYCSQLDGLPTLGELTSLRMIKLTGCRKLQKIEGLEGLKSLQTLQIQKCSELKALPSLRESTLLKEIQLSECDILEKIESLKGLASLEELVISHCSQLDGLPSLGELTSLRKIKLGWYPKLQKIEGLEGLKSLQTLEIYGCRELKALPSLGESTLLKELVLRECHNCNKIEGTGLPRLLETMILDDCREFHTLPNLADLTSLVKLELIKCYKLEKIGGLDSLRSLKMLRIEDCPESNTITSLVKLTLSEEFELDEFEVHACLKAPYRVLLEYRKLIVAVNDVSVVEPFISEIQTWQRQVIICARTAIDTGSLKNFFTSFPLENVVEFTSFGGLILRRPEDANAFLICFILDSPYPELYLYVDADTGHPELDSHFITELGNGKWVWMGAFPQGSDWLQSKRYKISASSEDKYVKLKEAWVLMGKTGSVLHAFHHLSQR